MITFLYLGNKKCPKCGVIGNETKEHDLKFLRCPLCNTEFTGEMILNSGRDFEIINN